MYLIVSGKIINVSSPHTLAKIQSTTSTQRMINLLGDDRALVNGDARASPPLRASIVPSFLGYRNDPSARVSLRTDSRPTATRPLDGAWRMNCKHSAVGLWTDCRPRPRGRSPTHKAKGSPDPLALCSSTSLSFVLEEGRELSLGLNYHTHNDIRPMTNLAR